jgi:holo-[acyl-carrier protein] synthase
MLARHKKQKTWKTATPQLVCGVDIVELERFARILKTGGQQFLHRIYTEAELAFCANRLPQLAVRFAAKEAISKALGTGIQGIDWGEIEIVSDQYGCPFVSLYGGAAEKAKQNCIVTWAISLSHSQHVAIAFVVASRMETSTGFS